MSAFACAILSGLASAAPATAAPRLLEYSDSAAVFLVEDRAVLVRVGERVPATPGTLRFLSESGATIEYPSAAGFPGAMYRLQRGAALPRRSDSGGAALHPEPALSAIQVPRDNGRPHDRAPGPAR